MGKRSQTADGVSAVHLGPLAGAGPGAGPNKFGARRSSAGDGREFASKAERDRYEELLLLLRAGDIDELQVQPRWHFDLAGKSLVVPVGTSGQRWQRARYTADFSYVDLRTGQLVVEDVKGYARQDASLGLRLGLMRLIHNIDVRLVRPAKLR